MTPTGGGAPVAPVADRIRQRRGPGRRGASLAELLVALVVLATGVLGVSGLLALGAEARGRALRSEDLGRFVAEVADSLRRASPGVAGARSAPGLEARWATRRDGGALRIGIRAWHRAAPDDTLRVVVVVADTLPVLPAPPRGRR